MTRACTGEGERVEGESSVEKAGCRSENLMRWGSVGKRAAAVSRMGGRIT